MGTIEHCDISALFGLFWRQTGRGAQKHFFLYPIKQASKSFETQVANSISATKTQAGKSSLWSFARKLAIKSGIKSLAIT